MDARNPQASSTPPTSGVPRATPVATARFFVAEAPLTPRRRQIAEVARALIDAEGPEAVTMRRIADALGIRASSLYKHVPDKAALEALVVARGFEEFAEVMEAAAEEADRSNQADAPADRLTALGEAYRLHAVAHPDLYRLMNYRRDLVPEEAEERAFRPILEAVGGDEQVAHAVWAFAHGMASLEIEGRLPDGADVDTTWALGISSLMITAHEHTLQQ